DRYQNRLIRAEALREDPAEIGGSSRGDGFLSRGGHGIRVVCEQNLRHRACGEEGRLRLTLPKRLRQIAFGERHLGLGERGILQNVGQASDSRILLRSKNRG